MRVSPIGWVCNSSDKVLAEAERSAVVSHNHPEAIKGAQAVALAVYMAEFLSDTTGSPIIRQTLTLKYFKTS